MANLQNILHHPMTRETVHEILRELLSKHVSKLPGVLGPGDAFHLENLTHRFAQELRACLPGQSTDDELHWSLSSRKRRRTLSMSGSDLDEPSASASCVDKPEKLPEQSANDDMSSGHEKCMPATADSHRDEASTAIACVKRLGTSDAITTERDFDWPSNRWWLKSSR
jgi:hypothetical protein